VIVSPVIGDRLGCEEMRRPINTEHLRLTFVYRRARKSFVSGDGVGRFEHRSPPDWIAYQ
jgi:hypothetical protein